MSPVVNITIKQEPDHDIYREGFGLGGQRIIRSRPVSVLASIEMQLHPDFLHASVKEQADYLAREIHDYYTQHARPGSYEDPGLVMDPNRHPPRWWERTAKKAAKEKKQQPETPIVRLNREVREVQEAGK